MEVRLYVYDLARGMARNMSRKVIGIQVDAVYHTSLVFDNVEYFYGAGIQMCYAGQMQYGKLLEKISLGRTEVPTNTILDYLETLKEMYTRENYDIFTNNCNNFSHDFAMFLVGAGIPKHIVSVPKMVLDTPLGRLLRTQIDASMRSITQVESAPNGAGSYDTRHQLATFTPQDAKSNTSETYGQVTVVKDLNTLEQQMASALATCTTIFLTSTSSAPCRIASSIFDTLASEQPQVLFIKADINLASDIAIKYAVESAPTFITFLKDMKQRQWSGADLSLLRSNVEHLIGQIFPPHPHLQIRVPELQCTSMQPISYPDIPQLDELMEQLQPVSHDANFVALRSFVEARNRTTTPSSTPVPDLHNILAVFAGKVLELPIQMHFVPIELLRCAMADLRVSGYCIKDIGMLSTLLEHVIGLENCPDNLCLATICLACNFFTSHLLVKWILKPDSTLPSLAIRLIASSIRVSHSATRVALTSLAFNLATANYRIRKEAGREAIAENQRAALAALLLDMISTDDHPDAVRPSLLALGFLAYYAPRDGIVADLCRTMDAPTIVGQCKSEISLTLAKEVASLVR